MFKSATFKIFLFCMVFTTIINGILCCAAIYGCSLFAICFTIICNSINSIFIACLFKLEYKKENQETESRLKQQIECSAMHVNTILNNLPLIAFIIDINYKFITGNVEALKFFNITDEEQFGKLSAEIFERETMELINEENDHIIQNKKTFVTDKYVKLKSGRQQWLRIRKVPLLNSSENVKGFVIFGRNIDAEKAAQKQRETYISTLSHDLKIPTLAQIRALELIISEKMGKINDSQKEILNLTLESCYCMYDMLSTILSTYKYENNDITLNYEKVHIMKLLDECFRKFYKTLNHKNIRIKVQSDNKFISLHADRMQIKKAFENLINYCISSAYENTEIICKIIKVTSTNNIFISLGFESPYISSETVTNMFRMYTTSAEKMDKVGSSLGLYLAKQIINAHNGNISVESSEANYNNCNILLPCINECKLTAMAC